MDEDGFDDRWMGAFINIEQWHFHRRLHDRYGIVLGPGEFSKIVADIRGGEALILKARKGRPTIYMAKIESARKTIFVAADRGGRLFTVFPPGRRFYRLKKAAKAKAKAKAGIDAPGG